MYLLLTRERGGGGRQYQLILFGQNKFISQPDTIRFNVDANATEFESRNLLLKNLKMGLLPFILKTDAAKEIEISMKQNKTGATTNLNAQTKDSWNYWVFRISLNGNLNMGEVYKDQNYYTNVSGGREK
ncbi:MAG: hypothetical protein C4308_00470 [Chitinophagaceae bacterium]